MEVTIDKFGRILIPKKIREALGLKSGQTLELVVDRYTRRLNVKLPADPEQAKILVEDSGLPVIQNGTAGQQTFDTIQFLKGTQEAYMDRKMGLND
ncbi:MAG: AbrB/MazE/SpoVT family DNA-binding domain-containing protein [Bacteroidetes bacterium]|nr:AbrB/MazE/SpoVT family DNA-binding domain-containing protein [Bacteroidota bacterium]